MTVFGQSWFSSVCMDIMCLGPFWCSLKLALKGIHIWYDMFFEVEVGLELELRRAKTDQRTKETTRDKGPHY